MSEVRLFVIRLNEIEAAQMGGNIEVQLLKSNGRTKAVAYVNPDCKSLIVGECEVGPNVVQKAMSLPEGQGIYIDLAGNKLSPF